MISDMDAALDAVIEIFTWVGLRRGRAAGRRRAGRSISFDGTWVPVRAVVEDDRARQAGALVRRGRAASTRRISRHEQEHASSQARAWPTSSPVAAARNRMRLTQRSPLVRARRAARRGTASASASSRSSLSWVLLFVARLSRTARHASASMPPAISASARPTHCTAATRSRSTIAARMIVPGRVERGERRDDRQVADAQRHAA